MGLELVTPPTAEPFDVTAAKVHLRVDVDQTDEDALIESLITAAREAIEARTGRALLEQAWALTFDRFPSSRLQPIDLPRLPLKEITKISYVDASGATVIVAPAAYLVERSLNRARITPAYGQVWPTARCAANAVRVEFTAGYTAETLPKALVAAMKLLVGSWYLNREHVVTGTIATELPDTVSALLGPYVVGGLG